MRNRLSLVYLLVASTAVGLPPQSALAQEPQKAVLFLTSLRRESPAAAAFGPPLERLIQEGLGESLDVYTEYIDAPRFLEPGYLEAVRTFYRFKYKERRFDVIVAIDRAAREFLARYRDVVFPEAPVVFVSVGTGTGTGAFPGATGFIAPLNFRDVLDSAVTLQPDTRHVVVVTGASAYDRSFEAVARAQFKELEARFLFTYLTGLPIGEILRQVAILPSNSIIIYTSLSEDGNGRRFLPAEMADQLSAAASAPLYGWITLMMDRGIVGGRMLSTDVMAAQLADLALRVLRGETPDAIPIAEVDATVTQFDWRQLRRWGIRESRLPPGSTILFRQPGAWEQYRLQIVGGTLLVALQTALIAGLLIQRTRRRRSERALRESERHFHLAIEAAPSGMMLVDRAGRIAMVNGQIERLFGYRRDELIGKPVEMLVPERFGNAHAGYRAGFHEAPIARQMGAGRDLFGVRKDGTEVPIEVVLNPLQTPEGQFVLGSVADTTERKRSEGERDRLMNQLEDLAGRLIEAQESERARIARDLHDDVSQQLAALSIALSSLKRRAALSAGAEGLQGDVSLLQQRTTTLAENVRQLSHDLHPEALTHAGLEAAIRAHCAELRRHQTIALTFEADGDFESIAPGAALCLYRVAQEALRNVVRHAGAHEASIRLLRIGDRVELTVADDGKGFDVARVREGRHSLGLVSIKERVRLAGGTVSIVTELGKGTRVSIRIPTNEPA